MTDLNNYFNERSSFYRILKHKHTTLTNYMIAKSRKNKLKDQINKYNLKNTIALAIQEEVLFRLGSISDREYDMLVEDILSYGNIINTYN